MAEVVKSKLKLLYLAKIMENETDEAHGISCQGIIERLAEVGIEVERKTVYKDLECLRAFGYDIVRSDDCRPCEYKLVNRNFQDQEIFLMADAVQSSRFLTQRKSEALVESIGKLGSKYMADGLRKRIHVEGRIKSQNESVFYNLDAIQCAMDARRKVKFMYYRYDGEGKPAVQHGGRFYVETPVQLVYMDDAYYLVVWNDKHSGFANYRVDRMGSIEVSEEEATRNEQIAQFDVAKYQQRVFGMFSGESVAVTLLVKPDAMNAVVDRFGRDVALTVTEEGRALVHVTVMEAPTFYGWLATLGTSVRIESPASIRDAYTAYLQKVLDCYE